MSLQISSTTATTILQLYCKGASDPAIDSVYVLGAHRRIFIKRVRHRLNGSYEVSSDNPNVKTVDVLGRVVWAWNGKKM